MKLIRFGNKGLEKPGVFIDGKRLDCSLLFEDWNQSFFQNDGLEKLADLLKEVVSDLPVVSEKIRWANPIARPGMIMCIGLNYSDHAKEAGMDIPTEPILFMKATNTIAGPFDSPSIPLNSEKSDWEVELGVVLEKDALYLKDEADAENHIAGYVLVNDLSERAFQLERGGQWVKGKSCPGFTPLGPYFVTKDEIEDVMNLKMKLSVNGELKQNGNTNTMIFNPTFSIWYISQFMKLEAGDLISTGTPPGVGMGFNPPQFLKAGDVIELEIDQLGSQKQIMK